MRKTIVFFAIIMLSGLLLHAQKASNKVEILYFKANLACCKAKACNALESDIQSVIAEAFPDSSVVLKEIKLVDTTNNALIARYNAQSQTVVIVRKKKNKEFSIDVSDIVKAYIASQSKETLKQELIAKVDEIKKKKN